MNQWRTAWSVAKDVGLTGTGIFVIILQAFSGKPNGLLLGTGLALTVPSTWDHIRALIPSAGGGSSSAGESSSSAPLPSPGESPSALTSEEHAGE